MTRTLLTLIVALVMVPVGTFADTYEQMWKNVAEAARADQPRTQIAILGKIAARAEAAHDYGQLLTAELRTMMTWSQVSGDSLAPAVRRMELRAERAGGSDPVLAAVCHAVLGRVYRENPQLSDSVAAVSRRHYRLAMEHPGLLARTSAKGYQPLLVKGSDSRIFADDMLSVMAYETGDFATATRYYSEHANRKATMLTSLEQLRQLKHPAVKRASQSGYVASLDSLISLYSDLPECGEVAMERYLYMSRCTGTTDAERIAYIDSALQRWGAWHGMTMLRNERKRIVNPSLTTRLDNVKAMTGQPKWLFLQTKNIRQVRISVTPVRSDGYTMGSDFNLQRAENYALLRKNLVTSRAKNITRDYTVSHPYEVRRDSVLLPLGGTGVYYVHVAASAKTVQPASMLCYVTDVEVVTMPLTADSVRYAVVDSRTGQPLAGAKLRLTHRPDSSQPKEKTVELTTDSKGEAVYRLPRKDDMPDYIYASTGEDKAYPRSSWYQRYYQQRADSSDYTAEAFTDRSVYRPGQTVRVAVIAHERYDMDKARPAQGRKVTLTMRDANDQTVAERTLTTDGYGVASADITLPVGGVNGRYSIETGTSGRTSFTVAEYKRPTFKVEFDKIHSQYRPGDTLTVTAHARSFAGVPVQGARVSYTVRRDQRWWRWYADEKDGAPIIYNGTATTDSAGTFRVTMPMTLPEDGGNDARYALYDITANATVTDLGGESQQGELSLPLSMKRTFFSCDLPVKAERDSLSSLTFTLKNTAMQDISARVSFTIDEKTYSAETGKPFDLSTVSLRPGRHTLLATCGGDTIRRELTVFTMTDTRPATTVDEWFYQTSGEFPSDGRPVYIQAGSSMKDVHVLYTIITARGRVEQGTTDLSDSIITRRLVYRPEYGDGLTLCYAWVKDGQLHSQTFSVRRPQPDQRLIVKWTTFRDRLTPGSREEWRLSVTDRNGKPQRASLMATLYDKSLEQIVPHQWAFGVYYPTSLVNANWSVAYVKDHFDRSQARTTWIEEQPLTLTKFDGNLFQRYAYGALMPGLTMHRHSSATGSFGQMLMAKHDIGVPREPQNVFESSAVDDAAGMSGAKGTAAQPQLRSDLSETAFFTPSLVSDERGEISLRFTLPQSVTTWKLMGIAHDMQMRFGRISGEAVASKAVMVQPNVPRFLRVGDHGTITARIVNTTGRDVKGNAVITFIDPMTGQAVSTSSERFTANAGSTVAVSFAADAATLYASGSHPLLICRVSVEGKTFSDGEQHFLPILPGHERVVTTQPLLVRGNGSQTVALSALSGENREEEGGKEPTSRMNRKITIEYTSSPAWLMAQALPSLSEPQSDNAMSIVSAYYANSLAAAIVGNSPAIRAAMALWQRETGSDQTLMGTLQRNQDVKTIMLSETPWVAEARTEAEQRRSMVQLFDTATIAARTAEQLRRLTKAQNPDGSFSWFKGMDGSYAVTLTTVKTLAWLRQMTGDDRADGIARRAAGWLGREAVKEVQRMKQQERDGQTAGFPDGSTLEYLYATARLGIRPAKDVAEANQYLIKKLASGAPPQLIYDKALAAIVLSQWGYKPLARQYAESLRQFTVSTPAMGRYFDGPRAPYSWRDTRIPTQVAAIEALRELSPSDSTTVTEMQQWLLQQKHVQGWDNDVATVNAIYAFFTPSTGMRPSLEPLSRQNKVTLIVDGRRVSTQPTAGMGYVKTTLNDPGARQLTIATKGKGVSWGAVYVTEDIPSSAVKPVSNGLSVTREVVGGTSVKAGGRVTVRLIITADRDYDFVQVEDRRAACLEPVRQTSGYDSGCYRDTRDNATRYYFDRLRKGRHVIQTEYYVDRAGTYASGTATVQCAYSPEYMGRAAACQISSN